MKSAKKITIKGIVQGVGFRPFVYRLAIEHFINGTVANNSLGVIIEAEGSKESLKNFLEHIKTRAPDGARIEEIICEDISFKNFHSFRIISSQKKEKKEAFIPPDIATCKDCIKELFDKTDRRFKYPFINCTNCGPRYTIIKNIPYDRTVTTMNEFVLCNLCKSEYENPKDRRFHAQPNACHTCGPSLELLDSNGNKLNVTNPFSFIAKELKNGAILALKGIGGFHLVCDAENNRAVKKIRTIKGRKDKPLAIMVPDTNYARKLANLKKEEEKILNSSESPIVLVEKKGNSSISPIIAPNLNEIGVMLPYTPVHHLLLKEFNGPLVMTSGNLRSNPIIHKNKDALEILGSSVDYFLLHNRDIHIRIDDSVIRTVKGSSMILRRARGYTPRPINVGFKSSKTILALGGMLKATFTFLKNGKAIISQYLGDLNSVENLNFYIEVLEHIRKLYDFTPDIVVCDLHPDYPTTELAEHMSSQLKCKLIRVQHHISHLAGAAGEHNFYENFIGVAFDGTGYGLDGNIWGGEIFWGSKNKLHRIAHIEYFPLPTGDKGIEEPWRIACSLLFNICKNKILESEWANTPGRNLPLENFLKVLTSLKHPLTSSAGRLLDGVASLLNIRDKITYEGQAAIELEAIADKHESGFYDAPIDGLNLDPYNLIKAVLSDQKNGIPVSIISARVHNTFAKWIVRTAERIRKEKETNCVILSGGVFQNKFLLTRTIDLLNKSNFQVLFNSLVPINDSGVSFGQAIIGALENYK